MKKKLTKYDFFAINRRLNRNYNAPQNYCGVVKKISHGEELTVKYIVFYCCFRKKIAEKIFL